MNVSIAGLAAPLLALVALLTGCMSPGGPAQGGGGTAATAPPVPSAALVAQFAPTGTLRAAINLGNPILAARDPGATEPRGVSVDLARELARRLGVPLQLVPFASAGQTVEALAAQRVDLGFVAIDPVRAADIGYSAPYVVIEGAYLVRDASPIRDNTQVDAPGNRIVVGKASAYDLYLTRALKSATLVRVASSPQVVDSYLSGDYEVAAGVRQQLEMDARRLGGVRMLPGRFMVIEQAMGVPRARADAAAWLAGFVEQMKASGFVAQALVRHRIEGASVAPASAGR